MTVCLTAVACLGVLNDAELIREVYRLKNRCFETKQYEKLMATDLPSFHAIRGDGSIATNKHVKEFVKNRFKRQISCRRLELPTKIVVKGSLATVFVSIDDEWTYRDDKGVVKTERGFAKGVSTWKKTNEGWKQQVLKFLGK